MEINITNKEKIYQVKLKDKLFLQNLLCINSLSFRKCLKHLYLFTDKIFLACNKTIMHIPNTYHCLSKLVLLLSKTAVVFCLFVFLIDAKTIKTTLAILLTLLLGIPFLKYYAIDPLLKLISSIMPTQSTPVRNILDWYFGSKNLEA